MGFQMMYRVKFGDMEKPFVYACVDSYGNVVSEPWDNGLNRVLSFSKFEIKYKPKGENDFKVSFLGINQRDGMKDDERYEMYITDSRLIFKEKSLKQDLKFTGSLVNLGIDAVFKKIEDKEVEGIAFLGHIRYEWIYQIMYFSKYSWDTNDMLRFSYFDHEMTQWLVTITFTNGMNVANAANEILHKACIYKDKIKEEKNEKYQEFLKKYTIAGIPRPDNPRSQFASVCFPTATKACFGETSRPELVGGKFVADKPVQNNKPEELPVSDEAEIQASESLVIRILEKSNERMNISQMVRMLPRSANIKLFKEAVSRLETNGKICLDENGKYYIKDV